VEDEKFLTKHQKLARGEKPYPLATESPEFGVKVSSGSKSYEAVGSTEKRRTNSYGEGDTVRGPGND
jgi:hypothetical protein